MLRWFKFNGILSTQIATVSVSTEGSIKKLGYYWQTARHFHWI